MKSGVDNFAGCSSYKYQCVIVLIKTLASPTYLTYADNRKNISIYTTVIKSSSTLAIVRICTEN